MHVARGCWPCGAPRTTPGHLSRRCLGWLVCAAGEEAGPRGHIYSGGERGAGERGPETTDTVRQRSVVAATLIWVLKGLGSSS